MKFISRFLLIIGLSLWNASGEDLGRDKNMASTILTAALAERILSADVEPGAENSQPDGGFEKMRTSRCSYKGVAVKGKQAAFLDFSLRKLDSPELAKAQFESSKIIYRGNDVSSVGEAAFRPKNPSQLHVLKGRYYIVVTAPTPNQEENAAAEILRRLRD